MVVIVREKEFAPVSNPEVKENAIEKFLSRRHSLYTHGYQRPCHK